VFDFSNDICLIDIENGREVRREMRGLVSRDPFRRAREVLSFGAEVLVCGALSRQMEMALAGAGIRTTGFICGNMEEVIAAFLQGRLEDGRLFMPGRSGRMLRHRRRNRCGKG